MPKWLAVDAPRATRSHHSAVMLADGRVLIAGGFGGFSEEGGTSGPLASTELWDPRTGRWEDGPPLDKPRTNHGCVALADGRVLVTGGCTNFSTMGRSRTALIGDPAHGVGFTVIGRSRQSRSNHQPVQLPDGRVLDGAGTVEILDLTTGQWSTLHAGKKPMKGDLPVVLHDRTVLFVNGIREDDASSGSGASVLWNPETNEFRQVGTTDRRLGARVHLVGPQRVLVLGGRGASRSTALFDGSWTSTGELAHRRSDHASDVLRSGEVLVVGGNQMMNPVRDAELWEPATGTWRSAGRPADARLVGHTLTALPSSGALVVGGNIGSRIGPAAGAEMFDPSE